MCVSTMVDMNTEQNEKLMEKIISLSKNRGFIFQAGELYGGLAGIYDYGPLGSLLKNNIKNAWIRKFVEQRRDMYLLDSAIIMGEKALTASGHVGGFSDPIIECLECGHKERVDSVLEKNFTYQSLLKSLREEEKKIRSRADKLIRGAYVDISKAKELLDDNESIYEYIGNKQSVLDELEKLNDLSHFSNQADFSIKESETKLKLAEKILTHSDELLNLIKEGEKYLGGLPAMFFKKNNIRCSVCKKVAWADEAHEFNLMLKTQLGSSSDSSSTAYLRPETAQGIFVNYKNIMDSMHPKIPFGVAQIGKAYRNEITPRNFIFRLRELEQMEIEYFIHPDRWEEHFEYWRVQMHEWTEMIGLDQNKLHELEITGEDLAHYSKRTIDFEFEYPFGQKELYGLAYRTDYDLKKHGEASKTKLQYTDPSTNETFIPHVIEPSMGLDRTILALLVSAYREDEIDGKTRSYLALKPNIAPYKIAVSPLVKNKEHIVTKANEVFDILKSAFGNVAWDDNGNIGKRYRRQDEIGTPFCVVIDYDTLEEGNEHFGTVSVRYRDTAEQERVAVSELEKYFLEKLA